MSRVFRRERAQALWCSPHLPATKEHVHDIWAASHGPQPGCSAHSPPLLLSGRCLQDSRQGLGKRHEKSAGHVPRLT